jgi:hypothetical protein
MNQSEDGSTVQNFHIFHQMIEMEYKGLENYIQESLDSMSERHKAMEASLRNEGADASHQISRQYFEMTPLLLKNSLYITAWSFLEYSLKKFCEIAASKSPKLQKRVAKLNRPYQYHSFLKNEIKLDVMKVKDEWDMLNIFREIRNCIIHHYNLVTNVQSATYNFIKENPAFEFEEPDKFQIKDDKLILELMAVSEKYLFTLLDEYEGRLEKE